MKCLLVMIQMLHLKFKAAMATSTSSVQGWADPIIDGEGSVWNGPISLRGTLDN